MRKRLHTVYMHRILSLTMAAGIGLGAFWIYHIIHAEAPGDKGRAEASAYLGAVADNFQISARENDRLRKTISAAPDNILKLTAQDVFTVFDRPELVRRDVPTVVWQYRNDHCVLDVYFITETRNMAEVPVAHYEIRAREQSGDDHVTAGACLRVLSQPKGRLRMVGVQDIFKAVAP